MRISLHCSLFVLVAALVLPGVGRATVYDPAAAFSPTANPNGVWSYGYSATLGGAMMLDPERATDDGIDVWRTNIWLGAPAVAHNGTSQTITNSTGTLVMPPGALSLHPGPGGQYSVLRFTVPSDGAYQIAAAFSGLDVVGTTTDVHVLTNGAAVFNGQVNGYGPGPSYSASVGLKAGDTIDFAVGWGANQEFSFDSTGLSAQITAQNSTPACQPPPAGLAGWWPANGNPNDVVGGNNGIPVGKVVYGNGMVGQAFGFDGSSYLYVSNSPSLSPAGSFSLECWLYLPQDVSGQVVVVSKWGDSGEFYNQRSYVLDLWPNRIVEFSIADAAHQNDQSFQGLRSPAGTLTLQAWNHVVGVYDQSTGTRTLYINGVNVAQRTDAPITILNSAAPLSLGAWYRGAGWVDDYFTGALDEFSLYHSALSATDVQALYQAGSAGKCPPNSGAECATPPAGLVSWWQAEGNVLDSAGTNTGALVGNVVFTNGKVGEAFHFDGHSYVRVPNSPNLNPAGSFSVECWVYPDKDPTVWVNLVGKWGDSAELYNQRSYAVGLQPGGAANFSISDAAHQSDPAFHAFDTPQNVITLQAWNHLVAVYDQSVGARRIYVNGIKVAERIDSPITVRNSTAPLGLGARIRSASFQDSYFTGSLDEGSFYSRALSDAEVQALFVAGSAGKCFNLVAPVITTQPVGQVANVGASVGFTVGASGTPPLSYQWFFNGAKLPGRTATTLSLADVQLTNAGTYAVVVSNLVGVAVSSNAVLTVNTPLCVAPPPGIVSWWRAESNALDSVSVNNGTLMGNAHYGPGRGGQGLVLDGLGDAVNLGATSNLWMQNFTLEAWVRRASTTAVSYQGNGNGHLFSIGGPGSLGFYYDPSGQPVLDKMWYTHVGAGVTVTDTNWHHLAVTKSQSSVVFYIDGTPHPVAMAFDPGFIYSSPTAIGGWFYGGVVQNSFYGSIDEVSVYNRALSLAEIQSLYQAAGVGKCTTPPYIVSQPASVATIEGSKASLSVTAGGDPMLRYQWYFNGASLPGATGTLLSLTNVQWTNSGSYSVLVANAFGRVVSSNAVLSVDRIPVAQCASVVVPAGANCTALASVDHGSFDPDGDPITLTQVPPGPYPLGTNLVTLVVRDNRGASNVCSALVVVLDQTPPTLVVPAAIVVTNAHDAWTSVVSYAASASDNCSGVGQPVCTPPSGTAFSLGTTTVNASVADAAGNTTHGSFKVTVLPGNVPPVPLIDVQPLVHFPGHTNLMVIAPDNQQATVVLDGSKSYDLDDTNFLSFWYEGTNLLSTNLVATVVLGLGTNDITLWLDDTFPLGTNSATVAVQVISPAQAVDLIISLLRGPAKSQGQDLMASLKAAIAAFQRGDFKAGAKMLQAFENKVNAQVAPENPELADELTQAAQQILNALTPATAAGPRHVQFLDLKHQQGKMHLRFAGQPGKAHLVQASTNMVDWQTIGVATDRGTGSFEFEDTKAAGVPARFYRIVAP